MIFHLRRRNCSTHRVGNQEYLPVLPSQREDDLVDAFIEIRCIKSEIIDITDLGIPFDEAW